MLKWEGLRTNDNNFTMHRAKVLGGWLVRQYSAHSGSGVTFVPDADHQWGGTSPE